MFKLALVALLCAQAFARPHQAEINPYILRGTKAKEGDYPFAVALKRPNSNESFCGGALLSDRYVLTAARCVTYKKPLIVGAGSIKLKSQTWHDVEKTIVHPRYDCERRIKNDIALIKLKTPFKLGKNIQTIKFPVNENVDGTNGTSMGWGLTGPEEPASQVMSYLAGRILSNEECIRRLKYYISESQVCFLGEREGQMFYDDTGSPLLYKGADGKNYLAGVYSWSIDAGDWKGLPDIFTRVSYYVDWITENMV